MALPILPLAVADQETLGRAWSERHLPWSEKRLPWATLGLVALTVLVHVLNVYVFGYSVADMKSVYGVSNLVVQDAIEHGSLAALLGQLVHMVTYLFAHHSWWHLIGNMTAVLAFGPALEHRMGWRRFLAFYILAGFLTALIFVAANIGVQADLATIGASGVTFALIGAAFFLPTSVRVIGVVFAWGYDAPFAFIPIAWMSLIYIGIQIIDTVATGGLTEGGLNRYMHLISAILGLLAVLFVPWFSMKPDRAAKSAA